MMWPFRNKKRDAERAIAVLDDAIEATAHKWLYFSNVLTFRDEVGLAERIASFAIPMYEGLRTNFAPLKQAPEPLLLMIVAKGIEKSETHTRADIEQALGISLPSSRKEHAASFEAAQTAELLMKLGDDQLATVAHAIIQKEEAPTHAMIVVAYQNLIPIYSAFRSEADRDGKTLDFADMLMFAADYRSPSVSAKDKEEVLKRRFAWFLAAFAVLQLTDRAERNPEVFSTSTDIWLTLAKSGGVFPSLLQHNIVWKNDEKEWFSIIKDGSEGINFVSNFIVPKSHRRDIRFQEFAKEHKFRLSLLD
jgi:hypothetical protein